MRVHEPLSVLDALEIGRSMHLGAWSPACVGLEKQGHGLAFCSTAASLPSNCCRSFRALPARPRPYPAAGLAYLRRGRTDSARCGVRKMKLMSSRAACPA